MITFVLLAATFTVAGVIAVAVPLLRRGALAPASWAALGAGAVLVLGSALLYVTWSNWSWRASAPGDTPQTMVAHLARQLEQDPKNLDGWLMLGALLPGAAGVPARTAGLRACRPPAAAA